VADEIIYIGERLGVAPARCTLEITETVATGHLANTLENLVRLQMRGYGISIDDYGTGFSSMQQLLRIPFTELKIDQSFVTGAAARPNVRAILESSVQLARSLRLKSVAEGIETPEEWALLKSLGCDIGQGYYIARPMPASTVPDWLRAWNDAASDASPSD
jgi:EAL domain-containing protein (putative c-di-GMP-specific phosphodiesterase class I)